MLFVVVLLSIGRVPICECGYIKLWHGVIFSSENSQHLTDWYTFSHIIHGFGFYFAIWLVRKKWKLSLPLVFLLILTAEVSWEVFENTSFVIERYRATTISLDYYGDSVVNSFMDVVATMVGAVLAYLLPVWALVTIWLGIEFLMLYSIRDSMILNIIMLIYPFWGILEWQKG